jgi:hypothetical protein
MRTISNGGRFAMSRPRSWIVPSVTDSRPLIRWNPFGPMMA